MPPLLDEGADVPSAGPVLGLPQPSLQSFVAVRRRPSVAHWGFLPFVALITRKCFMRPLYYAFTWRIWARDLLPRSLPCLLHLRDGAARISPVLLGLTFASLVPVTSSILRCEESARHKGDVSCPAASQTSSAWYS